MLPTLQREAREQLAIFCIFLLPHECFFLVALDRTCMVVRGRHKVDNGNEIWSYENCDGPNREAMGKCLSGFVDIGTVKCRKCFKSCSWGKGTSKILQLVVRREAPFALEADSSLGSSGWQMFPKPDGNRRRASKRVCLPTNLPLEPLMNISAKTVDKGFNDTSSNLAPLQLEARSAFQTSRAMSSSVGIVTSSPESSLDSPDIHPFRVSSSGAEESWLLTGLPTVNMAVQKRFSLSRSTSGGYEASGGEDSD